MLNCLKFSLPEGYKERQLISELVDHYSVKKAQSISYRYVFYDTFDWRLFKKSLVLYGVGDHLFLRKLYKTENIHSIEITVPPVFIWDFPESELKQQLEPVLKMRALMKLAEADFSSTSHRILNADQKTVAQLGYEEVRNSRDNDTRIPDSCLWVKPIKGYTKYSRDLAERLKQKGFSALAREDVYIKALEAVALNPGSYSSKLKIQLKPDMRSDEATRVILRFLLKIMRINEAYIEKDLDTEFLHDFRVSIRRTRSALGQIKNVFPEETTRRFQTDFVFVGKLTNRLRDLDVYLLEKNSYRAMLPDTLRNDIDPLFDYLREERSKALKEVVRSLKSKKYARIFRNWEEFLNEPGQDSPAALNANLPIIDLARKRIHKKYRNILNTGSLILENTEDEMLHALRIECKKLRYLMEFFSSLFPQKKINARIEQMKKLQDNLGEFNDLCVHEKYLLDIAKDLPATVRKSKKTLLAIGSLIGTMDTQKQRVKDAFAKTFTDYALSGNRKLFEELFVSK